ncbi:MAG: glycosyltransferase [Methanospirillum sp.]|uniref:glycosyltransferase n=1 Tax=Methanospirillum sp. TaxID=45200 RepID=UPI0023738EE6|nr:glycosyltransferase [Methanospirillum sp.]MDD1729670.1 glycosyltransferase [Methanospirillum sp.]
MTQKNPLVSIVTPSFNKGPYIEETIRSILEQTYPNIEYIIIDGGSTDGTLDILKKYGDRVSWISEPDRGQSDAINKGWMKAKGEIIAYLNADDTYPRDAV